MPLKRVVGLERKFFSLLKAIILCISRTVIKFILNLGDRPFK